MNEKTKVFLLHRIGNGSEVEGKYVTPCYIKGLFASDGILDLDQDKNFISQEYVVKLDLKYGVLENGDKKIDKKLSMLLVRETFGHEIVTSQMWKRAVEIKEPIYMEWCLEFFSSVVVKKEITNEEVMTDKFLRFRLGGVEREVTLYEFGKLLGIYSKEEMNSDHFEKLVTNGGRVVGDFDADAFWKEISGEDVIVYGKKRVWKIKDPLMQVFQKILVKSVFNREYHEQYVLDAELWILFVYVYAKHLSCLNLT